MIFFRLYGADDHEVWHRTRRGRSDAGGVGRKRADTRMCDMDVRRNCRAATAAREELSKMLCRGARIHDYRIEMLNDGLQHLAVLFCKARFYVLRIIDR